MPRGDGTGPAGRGLRMDPAGKQVGAVSKADKRVKVLRPGVKKVSANRLSSSSPTFHSIAGKSFVY
jgi:hypothetical protein